MISDGKVQLDKSKRGVALLYEVSRTVVSSHYLEEILGLIVGLTAELMGSKICSLMLLDEAKQELVIKATQSLSDAYRSKPPVKIGESVSGRAVKMKHPISVQDVTSEPDYNYPEIARKEGLVSMIAVPMTLKNRAIGVLNCYTDKPHVFTEEEMQVLTAVANQAALAIENTKLLSEKVSALEALETRKRLERAKGILMKRKKMEEEAAYQWLQKESMDRRRSIKEIAEAIILAEEMQK